MTIDELAQRTRLTVRNIRAYQSRGLVPPPVLRGRTGYYGDDHLARIELIRELQSEGFNLEAIRRLIEGAHGQTEEVLRFTQAVREPFEQEDSREVDLDELAKTWGERADPRILRRALELGLLREIGDGRYEERSPRLSRAGLELARLGVDAETGLDVIATARRHAEGVAEAYVQLFLNEIWKPFVADGRPQERWPEVRDAIERLRPLATEVLLAIFGLAMTEATERAFGRELDLIQDEVRRDAAA
jgi:DNA-binding transcriptional MerR regulator